MQSHIPKVNPEFVHSKLTAGEPVHMIDVRSANEFKAEHAKGAKLLPLDDISVDSLHSELNPLAGKSEPVYLICTAGIRAEQAAEKLKTEGLSKLYVIKGGTDAWKEADLPVNSELSKSWIPNLSPQAQAQMVVGLLIMLFAIKGLFIHAIFMVFVVMLGFMMLLSSINRRYCIANVISELPWNKTEKQV